MSKSKKIFKISADVDTGNTLYEFNDDRVEDYVSEWGSSTLIDILEETISKIKYLGEPVGTTTDDFMVLGADKDLSVLPTGTLFTTDKVLVFNYFGVSLKINRRDAHGWLATDNDGAVNWFREQPKTGQDFFYIEPLYLSAPPLYLGKVKYTGDWKKSSVKINDLQEQNQ